MTTNVYQEIFWLASASAAWVGFVVAVLSYFRARHEGKAKLYLDLRSRYLEIRRHVPDLYFNVTGDINESDANWVFIEQYWYQAFDEWFTTNKLNNGKYKDLWNTYFSPAIQSTLKYRPMRKVVWRMTKGHVSFGIYGEEFRAILDELWRGLDKDHKNLSDNFDS